MEKVVGIRDIQQWRGRENFFVGGTHTKRKRENRKNEEDSKQRCQQWKRIETEERVTCKFGIFRHK